MAVVEKIEDQRKPDDFFGYHNRASPGNYACVHVLNFCVRDGHETERCQWQIKRGRSVCRGQRGTKVE